MFGWNFDNSSDRKKLFILLFFLFSSSAMFIWWITGVFNQTVEEGTQQVIVEEIAIKEEKGITGESERLEEVLNSSESQSVINEEAAKQVAQDFARAFYAFDEVDPMAHVENSREFMTDSMYSRERRNQEQSRSTLERVKAEIIETSLMESAHHTGPSNVAWVVMIQGEITDVEGNKRRDESWYHVALTQDEERGWLVTEVRIDEST